MWYFNPTIGAYMGDRISLDDPEISDCPSSRHTWNGTSWELTPWYDWQGLYDALRSTVFFALAFGTANANAFTLLNSTLSSTPDKSAKVSGSLSPDELKLQDLAFAITVVRAGMPVDYSDQQLADLRLLLQQYGFPVFL
jgi:hypothetical protein